MMRRAAAAAGPLWSVCGSTGRRWLASSRPGGVDEEAAPSTMSLLHTEEEDKVEHQRSDEEVVNEGNAPVLFSRPPAPNATVLQCWLVACQGRIWRRS